MSRYYHVIGLIPEKEIREEDGMLHVDITRALHRPAVHNDIDILAAQQKGESIWASGGGTYLLNGRYLLTVRRSPEARVNPGKFSLFTGRADSCEELQQPGLLIRELFEELILYSGPRLCKPVCGEFREVIDRVYAKLSAELGIDDADAKPLPLRAITLAAKNVTVINEGSAWRGALDYHVNQNKEINFLFVLAGEIELANLVARDGEYHFEGGKAVEHKRDIYLYDTHTSMGQNISSIGQWQEQMAIPGELMTEHMRYLVDSVTGWLAANAPNGRSRTKTTCQANI
ncbi:MAG: hypothetical protein KKH12_08295 [Gammaproteobacteria bacterium]|nr:hypothetical protein [Gammaproteobacteria bacterium]MBU1481663.1 hypothetical protein [Gammaproteobacteria bacterium]